MKLNLDFYKEKEEVKDELLEVLQAALKTEKKDILEETNDINVIHAISNVRENILSWYPFNKENSLLELGSTYGEITKLLCEKSKNVISIVKNKANAEYIEKRYKNIENLEIIVGNADEIQIEKKFDIIVIEKYENYLENSKFISEHLNPNGKIILMFDNLMGINKFVNLSENIVTEKEKIKPNFDILNIEKKLAQDGFIYKKFYYPFPDYKLANIIYTDEYLPTEDNLSRNLRYKDYLYSLNENKVLKYILKLNNDYLKIVSNSFLIELSKEQFEPNGVKAAFFTNQRKNEKRICTVMCKDNVYKYSNSKENKEHLEQVKNNIDIIKKSGLKTLDSYDDEKIISRFSNEKSLDKVLMEKYHTENVDALINEIKKFEENLKTNLEIGTFENNVFDKFEIEYDKEKFSKLHYLKHGLWDLSFQNCFYIDNDYYFYDQEWKENNVPLEYIIYRAIFYFGEIKKYNVEEDLYRALGVEEYLEEFKKLDDKIQTDIRNELVWKWHLKSKDVNLYINELKYQIDILNIEKSNLIQENLRIKENSIDDEEAKKIKLELEDMKNLLRAKENQIAVIENSKSWKITKPLRDFRSIFNNRK